MSVDLRDISILFIYALISINSSFLRTFLIRVENEGAAVSIKAHLLQFSTGSSHPLALSKVINLLSIKRDRFNFLHATISGPKIFLHCPLRSVLNTLSAIGYSPDESIFLVFDWVTGNCIFVS